jgi:hypothetical protein
MRTRNTPRALIAAASVAAAAALAAPAGAAVRHVHPGQSIQAAVDAAHPGDTITVAPGVYRENLTVQKSRITLRGAGSGARGTVLEPPATPHDTPCNEFNEVNGICVAGQFTSGSDVLGKPVKGVTVSGFQVRGFTRQGIVYYNALNTTIAHNRVTGSRHYGIVGFSDQGIRLLGNVADHNGQGGIHIGDAPHANALVAGNDVYANKGQGGIGIYIRDPNRGVLRDNRSSGNCGGIVLASTSPAGMTGWTVKDNKVQSNTLACGPIESTNLPLSGLGMLLLGTSRTTATGNMVTGNRPSADSPFCGGILVASSKDFGGADPSHNTVNANRVSGNKPANVYYDKSGKANKVTG